MTDTGDPNRPKVRCRLVGRELRSRTKGTLLAHELFSSMHRWEIFKVLLGLFVSDDAPDAEGEELEMVIFDISRAHFMAPMDGEACTELPQEDKLPEDGDAVGLLPRSMYGFRTASANWQRDWQATLVQGWCGKPRFVFFIMQKKVAEAECTETTLLWLARVEHWTGWQDFIWQVLHARIAQTWFWESL